MRSNVGLNGLGEIVNVIEYNWLATLNHSVKLHSKQILTELLSISCLVVFAR